MPIEQRKIDRLDRFLRERDLSEVWFARPNNFAWLTGGDSVVNLAAPLGVAAAGFDGETVRVVTSNNERARFVEEELPASVEVEADDWYASSLAESVRERASTPAAADFDVEGFDSIETPSFRWPLTEAEVDRYRDLGERTAAAVEAVGRDVTAETTEREAAAALKRELGERGLEAPVVLVGGSERAPRHRHFTPTDEPLDEFGILTVVGSERGLHVAVTRTVAFDPPEWLTDRYDAAGRVAASAVAATANAAGSNGTSGDVFGEIQSAYDEVGYPDEWREHHQGGAIGYDGREWIATPSADDPVEAPMAYAWNPTVQGAKIEETVLVTGDGVEVLTATGDWPSTDYEATDDDLAVPAHDILRRDE